jgi:hypothetical protein
VSFLPPRQVLKGYKPGLDSIILLEQTEPGKFVRHSLEKDNCHHMTCVAGAWDGDGRVHFATGFFTSGNAWVTKDVISLWKSQK